MNFFLPVLLTLFIIPSLSFFLFLNDYLSIHRVYIYQLILIEVIFFFFYIHITMKITDLIYKIHENKDMLFLLKTGFLIAFVVIVFVCSMIDQFDSKNLLFYEISVLNWLLGYFIALLISYFIRLSTFTYILKERFARTKPFKLEIYKYFFIKYFKDKEGNTGLENSFVSLLNTLLRIFTPDYSYAVNFKVLLTNEEIKKYIGEKEFEHSIKKYSEKSEFDKEIYKKYRKDYDKKFQKETRKIFIEYTNWFNIMAACLYLLIGSILVNFNLFLDFFFCFIFFRVSSRCLEIILAFYKDVVRTKRSNHSSLNSSQANIDYKSSALLRGNRISLAIHSYLEVIILFAIIYYLAYANVKIGFISLFGESIKFIDFLFYSFSISAFNVSLVTNGSALLKYFHTLQILTSLNLVVLSLATYIGFKDKREE